jgi:hypothetical protein
MYHSTPEASIPLRLYQYGVMYLQSDSQEHQDSQGLLPIAALFPLAKVCLILYYSLYLFYFSSGISSLQILIVKGYAFFVIPFHESRSTVIKHYICQYFVRTRNLCLETVKKAGLTNVTLHTLRHTFASQLALAGVPLRDIQELMGHQSFQTTLQYAHLSEEHVKKQVLQLPFAENFSGHGHKLGT